MATAGGKVILAGEHAVVYGAPALALGLSRGVRAQARQSEDPKLSIAGQEQPAGSENAVAYEKLLKALAAPPHHAEVTIEMPVGVGLGASAAIGVALARAVLASTESETASHDPRILTATAEWEGVFHGSPSGIDAACAFLGGCIHYEKGLPPKPVAFKKGFDVAIAVAGPASSTKAMVEDVARLRERNPTLFRQSLEAIATLTRNAEQCLLSGDLAGLGSLMNYNQMLLSGWFVSTPEIEHACRLARDAGALGAKLTGAGGGGCVIALCPYGESEPVLQCWRDAELQCFADSASPGGS